MRKYISIIIGLIRLVKEYILNIGRLKIQGILYCVSKGVIIRIGKGGQCNLGVKTWLSENCIFEGNGEIQLGYNNFFNTNCRVVALESITIGDNNLFGPNVIIVDHDHQHCDIEKLICKQGFVTAPIKIGSNVWIGGNVTICKGVSIVDGVIVGANSVVTKSLMEPGIYAGIPAKMIRSR